MSTPQPQPPPFTPTVACPYCGAELEFVAQLAGQAVRCPHCNGEFTMRAGGRGPGSSEVLAGTTAESRRWAFFIHLSVYCGYFVPIAGIIVPVVIWQLKRDEFPELDRHGKNVVNWFISCVIYVIVLIVLSLALIGIPLLIAFGVWAFLAPLIAAIKAGDGKVWRYPLSMQFV